MNNLDLNKYIKTQLDNNDTCKKCLQDIGKSFGQYTNYHDMLNSMNDDSIRELYEAITDVQFFRKRFTNFVTCSREEANKPADDNRSIGFFTYGEYGGEYGYFKHLRKLTDYEEEWLEEYKECCYYSGQPCARWQDDENTGEDCECILGREQCSLILYELNEQHEKELGVWKQEIIWYLDTNYNIDEPEQRFFLPNQRFYSLTEVKKNAINSTDDEKVIEEIFQYKGDYTFKKGNIMIKYSNQNLDSDSD